MTMPVELQRFVRHLTVDPYVRTTAGAREMLANRPAEDMPEVELNGVLRRYVAVSVPASLRRDLPLPPTITVERTGLALAHCLWELREPVTHSANGRMAPVEFWQDVESSIASWMAKRAAAPVAAGQAMSGLVLNPLHPGNRMTSTDALYALGELRRAFGPWERSGTRALPTQAHYRSGKNAAAFELARSAAAAMAKDAASPEDLTHRLLTWTLGAHPTVFDPLTEQEKRGLCGRIAAYVFERRRGTVSRATALSIREAIGQVAHEHRIAPSQAHQHLARLIAERAGVSVRTVRRTGDV